jgi:hypothetical protein
MADATHGGASERDDVFLAEQTGITLRHTEYIPVPVECTQDRSANYRVEAGCVTAAG